jgi:hypothetical protein
MPSNSSSTPEPSTLAGRQSSTQPLDNPPNDTQPVAQASKDPVLKRRAKRALEKRVAEKAVELDKKMQVSIDEGAEELGVPSSILAQKFAIVAPIGETRKPMWWNGLVAEKSEAWKPEYGACIVISDEEETRLITSIDGPGRDFLPWVVRRIRQEELSENLGQEERERLAKKAEKHRAANKEEKAARMTRAKSLKAAEEQIESMYEQVGVSIPAQRYLRY